LLALSALLAGCLPADDSGVKQELGNFIKVGHLAALDIVQEGPSGPIVFDVSGNEAYIAIAKCSPDEEDGLRWLCDECWWREIDLSDPTMPKEAGLDVVPFAVEVLDIYEDHAYIVSSWPNLYVLDMSTPSTPREVASHTLPFFREANDMTITGELAWVSGRRCLTENDCTFGLWVTDLVGQQAPTLIGFYPIARDAYRVLVNDRTVLVTDLISEPGWRARSRWVGDVWRIDTAGTAVLVEEASLELPGLPSSITLSGNHLFVGYPHEGLQVLDISNVSNPIEIGYHNMSEGVCDIAITPSAQDRIYVMDCAGALHIFDFAP
jgi:hypothetical protein